MVAVQHNDLKVLVFSFASAVEFTFNGFNSSSSELLLYGGATIDSGALSLNRNSTFSIGRALYHAKVPTRSSPNTTDLLNFSTSFTFSITPFKDRLPGHGFVFAFVPSVGLQGASSSQHLGLFNQTNNGEPNNHVFGVEFDVFQNEEFGDINDNHVGVDVNSLTSIVSRRAGYCVTLANANHEKKPQRALIEVPFDLSRVFLDEMHVGFTASTGQLLESHKIIDWSFNSLVTIA
ncbi:hypothetical protein TIFTF001_014079 [Ficus carica]|uniref:Legume lectin domain-containing protein n=1 Tax=Ficus carica TaxID=3494 RepID=A0AA88AJ05_FICCA|nr:hypothetical protein TIFTF001_014079 [Ficus carica]